MRLKVALKIFCSAALLIYLGSLIEWQVFLDYCRQASVSGIALSFTVMQALVFLHWMRWQRLLVCLKVPLPRTKSLAALLGGNFFNQFLPSSVGGDVYRMWIVQDCSTWLKGISSVMFDRLLALVGLGFVYCLCYWFSTGDVATIFDSAWFVSLMIIMGYFAAVFGAKIKQGQYWLQKLPIKQISQLWQVWQQLTAINVQLSVLGLAMAIHLLNAIAFWMVLKAFHVPLALWVALLIFPVMQLVVTLPFSFAGWGLREGILVVLLGLYGVSLEQAVAISLVSGVLQLLVGLLSGVAWFGLSSQTFCDWIGQSALTRQHKVAE